MTNVPHRCTTAPSAAEHAARYEALRRDALAPQHAPGARDGLAVLLRQGLAAWMAAWSRVSAPPPRATAPREPTPPLPAGACAEVVRVLAAMALGHLEEGHT